MDAYETAVNASFRRLKKAIKEGVINQINRMRLPCVFVLDKQHL